MIGPASCMSTEPVCWHSFRIISPTLPPSSNFVSRCRRTEFIVANRDLESHGGRLLSPLRFWWMLCCAHRPRTDAAKTTRARLLGFSEVVSAAENASSSVDVFFHSPFLKVISSLGSCTKQCASAIDAGRARPQEHNLSRT